MTDREKVLEEALRRIEAGCSFPADDVQRAVRDVARAALAPPVLTPEQAAELRKEGEALRKEIERRTAPMKRGPFAPPAFLPVDHEADARIEALMARQPKKRKLAPPGPASEEEREHDCDDDPDCQLCHHVNAPKPAPPEVQPCVCEHWEGNHSPGCCFCGCMKYEAAPEALCRCYGDKFPLRDGCVPHASTPAPAAHVPPKGPRCGFRSRVIEAKCDMPEGHKGAHCDWVPLDAPDPDTLPRFSVRQVLDAVKREAVTTLDVFLGKEVEKVAVADLLRALRLSRREDM